MARKRPSRHSADQFALFLATLGNSLEGEEGAKFAEAIGKLVRNSNGTGDAGCGNSVTSVKPTARSTPLPERPAFERIEQAARGTTEQRSALMQLIGQLVFSWSNNESLLVYVLMLLLGTDERSAAAVFATLNTTRARLELVRRLMVLKVADPVVGKELEHVLERLNDAGRVRNEFLHAAYSVNELGEITHPQAMRFVERRGHVSFGDRQPIDEKRHIELRRVIGELASLNRTLRNLLPRLKQAISTLER